MKAYPSSTIRLATGPTQTYAQERRVPYKMIGSASFESGMDECVEQRGCARARSLVRFLSSLFFRNPDIILCLSQEVHAKNDSVLDLYNRC
jgi:hypothetical protein